MSCHRAARRFSSMTLRRRGDHWRGVGTGFDDRRQTLAVSDYQGAVVVLNYWGQWCGPCRAETPELEKVFESTRHGGVQFLGIDVRDPQKVAARDFVTDFKVSYPPIWDPAMRTAIALGKRYPSSVIPSTLVLDRHHRVAAVFLQALLMQDLLPVVERVAAER
jgi:thiol-disulfide isomerase/thioredoxin